MARYLGDVEGARGRVSRLGHASSGMTARAHGWDIGGRVDASPAPGDGFDRITFGLDGGSRDVLPHIGVADAVELEGGRILLTLWSPLPDELEPVARYTYSPGEGWSVGLPLEVTA